MWYERLRENSLWFYFFLGIVGKKFWIESPVLFSLQYKIVLLGFLIVLILFSLCFRVWIVTDFLFVIPVIGDM